MIRPKERRRNDLTLPFEWRRDSRIIGCRVRPTRQWLGVRLISDVDVMSRIDADGCTFTGNMASGGHGGALSLWQDCVANMQNCVFESNGATAAGCGNEAWSDCGGGGAVSMRVRLV